MRWLSILGFASAENFVVFYVQISGPVGGGETGGISLQILIELEAKPVPSKKIVYWGHTNFQTFRRL